ncbi:hypothetical protein ACE6H2_006616 [Prunus campanulata]
MYKGQLIFDAYLHVVKLWVCIGDTNLNLSCKLGILDCHVLLFIISTSRRAES